MAKRGRPRKPPPEPRDEPEVEAAKGYVTYTPEFAVHAAKLSKLGMTQKEIADFIGVTDRSVLNWRAKYPEFDAACQIGLEGANNNVELSLYKQSVGYFLDEEEIKIVGDEIVRVPVKRWYPPSVTAGIFWSKVKMKWRENLPVDPPPPEDAVDPAQIGTRREKARRVHWLLVNGGRDKDKIPSE